MKLCYINHSGPFFLRHTVVSALSECNWR